MTKILRAGVGSVGGAVVGWMLGPSWGRGELGLQRVPKTGYREYTTAVWERREWWVREYH